ncbi:MAG: glycosyltransferase family 4 protein [Methanoculleus sp.]|jgi:glycosyltransferase involved in cell wall biosynthesis|nr:glycosyltransferase family 4 protein [Methanoculleus sp.]
MRIALICQQFGDKTSYLGSDIYASELVSHLAGRGDVDLHVVTMGSKDAVRQEDGFTCHTLRSNGLLSLPYVHPLVLARMVRTIRAIHPDIVHVLSTRYPGSAAGMLLRNDYPFLVTAFGIFEREIVYYREEMPPLEKALSHVFHAFFIHNERWVLSRAPEIAVDAASIGEILGTPETGRLHVITGGIDVGKLRSSGTPPHPGPNPDIVFVNALTRLKGADVLLNALPRVVEAFPDVRVCIGGRGPQEPELRRLARDLGLEENVAFPGFITDEEKYDYYRRCKAVVVPSRWDCQPSPVFEAAVFGKPVIASDMSHPDIVEDGVTGLVFRSEDAAGLGEKILRLLGDDAARESMGRAAALRADEYDWKSVAERYVAVYGDVIRSHRRHEERAIATAGASPER